MSTRKVRVKKLSVKTPLPILREGDIDKSDFEALTTETQISTGVEAAEETVRCPLFACLFGILISRA
jgi:enhancer of polycomb-like protein